MRNRAILLTFLVLPLSFPAVPNESSVCITPADVTDADSILVYSRCLLKNGRSLEAAIFLEERVTAYQNIEMYALLGDAYNRMERWQLW